MSDPTQKTGDEEPREPGGDPSDNTPTDTKEPPQEADPGSGEKSDR